MPFLLLLLGLLAVDAALELALVSSTVAFLHSGVPSGVLTVVLSDAPSFRLAGKPAHLLTNPGHLSNAAAGTALLLVAGLGAVVLAMGSSSSSNIRRRVARVWHLLLLPALALTVAALAFVFAAAHAHGGQHIDLAVAAQLAGAHGGSTPAPYPLDVWPPPIWFAAVLELPLADGGARAALARHQHVALAWQYNLVALLVVEAAVVVAAVMDGRREKAV